MNELNFLLGLVILGQFIIIYALYRQCNDLLDRLMSRDYIEYQTFQGGLPKSRNTVKKGLERKTE